MFQYYIAYAYQGGFGSIGIARETPIRTVEEVQDIAEAIRSHNGFAWTVILNYQPCEP